MLLPMEEKKRDRWPPKVLSFEFLLTLWGLAIGSGALDMAFVLFYGDGESHRLFLRKVFIFPAQFYAFFYLLLRPSKTWYALRANIPLCLLFLLMPLSLMWTVAPDETAIRMFDVMTTSIFGLYLSVRYSPEKFLELAGRCLIFICFLTLIVIALNPAMGIHHDQHFPAAKGFFQHKNIMGLVMAVAAAMGFCLLRRPESKRAGALLFLLASFLAVVSLSRSAWLNLGFAVMAPFGILFLRKHRIAGFSIFYALLFLSFLGIAAVGTDQLAAFFSASLGRDVTFTGRTDIWKHIIEVMSVRKTWFGFGFEGFWYSRGGALGEYWGVPGFVPAHAHNGWLQALVNFGVVGLVLQIGAWVKTGRRAYRMAMGQSDSRFLFPFLFFLLFTIIGFSENVFFFPENLNWLLFVYFAYCPAVPYDQAYPPREPLLRARETVMEKP